MADTLHVDIVNEFIIAIEGRNGKKFVPVGDFLCLEDIKSWFPGSTGLEYIDAGETTPFAIVEREAQTGKMFNEPRGGWAKEGRLYRTIHEMQGSVAVAAPATPNVEADNLSVLMQSVRSTKKLTPAKEVKTYTLGAVAVGHRGGLKTLKTHVMAIVVSGNATFQELLQQLRELFHVTDGTSIRLGQLKNPSISSFNGMDFSTYLKSHGVYPSQIKVYLETEEKFANHQPQQQPAAAAAAVAMTQPDTAAAETPQAVVVGLRRKGGKLDDSATSTKKASYESVVLDSKELTVGKQIGKGGMARVYKGKWREMEVAIKQCEAESNKQAQQLADMMGKEIHIQLGLSHVNILPLFGYCKRGTDIMLVAELMDGALDKLLYPATGKCKITKDKKMFIIKEMLHGLWYLHEQNVVHGDIKPGNILIDKELKAVKLCDFGISRIKTRLAQTTTVSFIRGTVIYMAPETCLNSVKPNFETDVWCAGATILEILLQKELWGVPDDIDMNEFLLDKMGKQEQPSALSLLQGQDAALYRKVKRALQYDPKKRATAKEMWQLF